MEMPSICERCGELVEFTDMTDCRKCGQWICRTCRDPGGRLLCVDCAETADAEEEEDA